MGPRKELKDALAYEQALLNIYRSKIPPEYTEICQAFDKHVQEGENRIFHLRRMLNQYCGG